jgi:decaprenylphospho-beta-D-ribofuranose 2-oxidase
MKLTGWGKYPQIIAQEVSFASPGSLSDYLKKPGDCITYGMGRSYGDSALNERVILSHRFNKIIDFNPGTGLVRCESGVSLSELIGVFLPRGWFPGVVPGTQYISVGGAIASDVHGKNHHQAGCFSEFVLSLDLMLPGGDVIRCSREENRELFRATCGGMGLTGVILTATLRLQPMKSAYIRETVLRSQNLSESFALYAERQHYTYSVAWIDCLATGDGLGRGVLFLGEPADSGPLTLPMRKTFSVPCDFPGFMLNRYSGSWFNKFYYQANPAFVEGRLSPLDDVFFPLDRIFNWNRVYGRGGFTEYQFVTSRDASFACVQTVLKRVMASGVRPLLAGLKLFGPENENLLSFPRAGYTFAMDFKIQRELFPLLDALDRIVLDHGGRFYLAKDVRLSKEVFRKSCPQWEQFAELRERYRMTPKFNSRQSRRLGF